MPMQMNEFQVQFSAPDNRRSPVEDRLRRLEAQLASIFRPDGSIVLEARRSIDLVVGSSRIRIEPNSITIRSDLKVTIESTQQELNARAGLRLRGARLDADTAITQFNSPSVNATGMLKCDTLAATNVIGANYTPGAGNVW